MNRIFFSILFLLATINSFSQVCSVEITTNNDATNCINNTVLLETTLGANMVATGYKWFKNGIEIIGQTNPTLTVNSALVTTPTDIYTVEVTSNICVPNPATDNFTITYVDPFADFQLINISTIDLCDPANAGLTTFDLTQNEAEIANLANASDYTFTYFTDAGFTNQITDVTNHVLSSPTQTIYVSIQHNTIATCTENTFFEIIDKAQAGDDLIFNVCDDDTDGFILFNLVFRDSLIFDLQDTTNFSISYYEDFDDANNGVSEIFRDINDNVFYTNTTAFQQDIYARIENNANPDCFDITTIHLFARPLPVINFLVNDITCDDDADGIIDYNLATLHDQITVENDITFTYFGNLLNAQNNNNQLANIQTLNGVEQFFIRATTIFGCFEIAEVNVGVTVSQIPDTFIMPDPLVPDPLIENEFIQCDDIDVLFPNDTDSNGINTFNIGASITYLRDLLPSNQNVIIRFYEAENDAILEQNEILDPFEYRNLVPVGQDMTLPVIQNIWVRIENVLNDECLSMGQYITLTVNPLPTFDFINDAVLCLGETNTLTTNFDFINTIDIDGDAVPDPHTINWTRQVLDESSEDLGNAEFIDITRGGTYTVTITNTVTQCERTKSIEILESEKPIFKEIEISILNKPNNQAIIVVTGQGDYEYALENTVFDPFVSNEDHRSFQDSSLFENLNPGEYEVTVRDKNLCGEIKSSFIILDYKPYFTPNGDPFNETWTLNGMALYPISVLYIFDRHGKILAELNPTNPRWNGVYLGKIMKDSDYWFRFEYFNSKGVKDFQTGHFSLITQ